MVCFLKTVAGWGTDAYEDFSWGPDGWNDFDGTANGTCTSQYYYGWLPLCEYYRTAPWEPIRLHFDYDNSFTG